MGETGVACVFILGCLEDRCLCFNSFSISWEIGPIGPLCLHTFIVWEIGVCVFMRCLGDRCCLFYTYIVREIGVVCVFMRCLGDRCCLFHTYIVREIGVVCVFMRCLGDRCCLFHTYIVREIGVVCVFMRCVGDRCCPCVHIFFCQGGR